MQGRVAVTVYRTLRRQLCNHELDVISCGLRAGDLGGEVTREELQRASREREGTSAPAVFEARLGMAHN